jgi:hypothetical protein
MSYSSRVYRQRNAHTPDESKKEPFFSKQNDISGEQKGSGFFQPKLTVNKPGDSYEQEADSVASAVVNKSTAGPVLQHKKISSVQRLATSAEEEKLGTNDARMARDKEIQEKPMELASGTNEKEEEKSVQKKDAQKPEEEDKMKPGTVQAKAASAPSTAPAHVASKIESTAGQGQALPARALQEMSGSFGTDFSDVRIHKDGYAAEMTKELNAQAFTRGNDIYFNEGKFDPHSSEGKFLLAHELTHVVQQGDELKMKKDPPKKPKKPAAKAPGFDGTDKGTYIKSIDVSVNFGGSSLVTLNWANEDKSTAADPDLALPTSFKTSPGAGQCNRNCGDKAESNLTDSNCTPLGSFTVQSFAAHLGSDTKASSVTFYQKDRGIAFHYYDVPDHPQSHGCTRMEKESSGADWIKNNSIANVTTVNVKATGDANTREECYYGKSRITMEDYKKKSVRERILHWYKFGTQHKGGDDGDFYLKEAMTYANGLNDDDIQKLLAGKGKKELKEMYDATVAAPGVGADSNLAKLIWEKLNPPPKKKK